MIYDNNDNNRITIKFIKLLTNYDIIFIQLDKIR